MTINGTRPRAAKRTEEMERIRDRINLESNDILILVIILENPQGLKTSARDLENMNTSQDKSALLRRPSAKTAIKLDIFTKYARTRKEPRREPTLFRAPRRMMTLTLMKMESDNPIDLQG